MAVIVPKTWQIFSTNTLYQGKVVTAFLCDGTFTADSTLSSVQAGEINDSGYTRQSATVAAATFDTTDNRVETPQLVFTFTLGGTAWQYDAIAYVIGPNSSTFTDVITIDQKNSTQTIPASSTFTAQLDLALYQGVYS